MVKEDKEEEERGEIQCSKMKETWQLAEKVKEGIQLWGKERIVKIRRKGKGEREKSEWGQRGKKEQLVDKKKRKKYGNRKMKTRELKEKIKIKKTKEEKNGRGKN